MADDMLNQDSQDYFEIRFYQGLIDKKPDFLDALIALGDLYTKNGLYEDGLKIDLRLSKLKPEDPIILYNLACSYSLLNQADLALETLDKAITNGYDNPKHMIKDKDLDNVRSNPRFNILVNNCKAKPALS